MYRGFNLVLDESYFDDDHKPVYEAIGNDETQKNKKTIRESINNFHNNEGKLVANDIINNWFPTIEADIFLSHSHKDESLAYLIAGVLKDRFQLSTFIDSSVWGYAPDLLKLIDDKYCLNPNGNTYSYESRNYSTSHVYLMLSNALNRMIDEAECIIFLNTPNSISSKDVITKTHSPWIYSEISITKIIRKKTPDRLLNLKALHESIKYKNEIDYKQFLIEYDMNLSHLVEMNEGDFKNWVESPKISKELALNELYYLKP